MCNHPHLNCAECYNLHKQDFNVCGAPNKYSEREYWQKHQKNIELITKQGRNRGISLTLSTQRLAKDVP